MVFTMKPKSCGSNSRHNAFAGLSGAILRGTEISVAIVSTITLNLTLSCFHSAGGEPIFHNKPFLTV
jgi:hypothetical protein